MASPNLADVLISQNHFVNWSVYAHENKQTHDGHLPLFAAAAKGLKWSEGLRDLFNANKPTIECTDEITGLLETFMISAVLGLLVTF